MDAKVELNKLPLRAYKPLFSSLPAPIVTEVNGDYLASFIGPAWLRAVAGPSLMPTGLGNWYGTNFLYRLGYGFTRTCTMV